MSGIATADDTGSSPHVRGTQWNSIFDDEASRFIPACAGNTRFTRSQTSRMAVHPRMCGEHEVYEESNKPDGGSSPHVRGTQMKFRVEWEAERFIPACAGNTFDEIEKRIEVAVHPRMCGEH